MCQSRPRAPSCQAVVRTTQPASTQRPATSSLRLVGTVLSRSHGNARAAAAQSTRPKKPKSVVGCSWTANARLRPARTKKSRREGADEPAPAGSFGLVRGSAKGKVDAKAGHQEAQRLQAINPCELRRLHRERRQREPDRRDPGSKGSGSRPQPHEEQGDERSHREQGGEAGGRGACCRQGSGSARSARSARRPGYRARLRSAARPCPEGLPLPGSIELVRIG